LYITAASTGAAEPVPSTLYILYITAASNGAAVPVPSTLYILYITAASTGAAEPVPSTLHTLYITAASTGAAEPVSSTPLHSTTSTQLILGIHPRRPRRLTEDLQYMTHCSILLSFVL